MDFPKAPLAGHHFYNGSERGEACYEKPPNSSDVKPRTNDGDWKLLGGGATPSEVRPGPAACFTLSMLAWFSLMMEA